MRTVLVCVRTPLAAQTIAACAARLGVAASVRTAVSEVEVLARLAERPADIVLVDTMLTRPDPVAFTRRVLARVPRATLVLLGDQEPRTAAATVAAGARGVIRGSGQDLVTAVTKAFLLLCPPDRSDGPETMPAPAGLGGVGVDPGREGSSRPATLPAPTVSRPGIGNAGPAMVPQQRGDLARGNRRMLLTERELQVLRAMADGKSNAEIGRELFVSEDTVKTHARRLFRKLGARDRAHAVASGFRAGLVS